MDLLRVCKSLGDRILGWALIGLGGLVLILGLLGVRGTAYVVEQIPYVISGGLGGLFLLGVGTMLLLSADLRDQWRALLDIRDEIRTAPDRTAVELPAPDTARVPTARKPTTRARRERT